MGSYTHVVAPMTTIEPCSCGRLAHIEPCLFLALSKIFGCPMPVMPFHSLSNVTRWKSTP